MRFVLTQFTDETMSIVIGVLVLVFSVLVAYWFYNRRKFHEFQHQIPASVVKSYLDSIISNSNALKSSLFRGGGLDIGEGIPAILPTSELPTGGVALAGANSEELIQKNAEIANLKSLLSQKEATILELEKMLEVARNSSGGVSQDEYNAVQSELHSLRDEIEALNDQLEQARGSAQIDSGDLDSVIAERDELKERLMEYEIIEEDLANLKKYQQENEQLRKTIEDMKGEGASEKALEEDPKEVLEEKEESSSEVDKDDEKSNGTEEPSEDSDEKKEEGEIASSEESSSGDEDKLAQEEVPVPDNAGEQKSADELLSEFEKMLG